jgi:hypothetical protein
VSAPVASNIKVVGILAAGQKGSAILAIDGKPGKVYMLGDKVDGQLSLIGVDIRQVTLGQAGKGAKQTLPAPPKPEIGVLTQGPAKTAMGGASPPTGQPVLPGMLSPNPMSAITPPAPAILSPPPVINPGSAGPFTNGLPSQGTNPSLPTNPGSPTNPSVALPPGNPPQSMGQNPQTPPN